MARHRNVRKLKLDDYDFDDVYGHSAEDQECISPTDASQWMYDRAKGQHSMNEFLANHRNIAEESDEDAAAAEADGAVAPKRRRDSEETFHLPELDDTSQALLLSCMEEIRNVLGDSVSEKALVETIMRFEFDCAKALDHLLNTSRMAAVSIAETPPKKTPLAPPIEKGISERLLEKASGSREPSAAVAPAATVVTPKVTPVIRGFEISSPKSASASPAGSGRSSPASSGSTGTEPSQTDDQRQAKIKEYNARVKELYARERGAGKQQLHLVVIGHVDAGKSTLMGHLLVDIGAVSQRVMHKYEHESRKIGKQSFMYAWVLDETGEERERGITMDVGSSRFETDTKQVTLLDAPGHKDFIPNMISGANQADVALLVVDATRGEFETGFEAGGQTREHALLVRSLGVQQLGVVVNKLDTVNWSQERFDEIVGKLRVFLKQAGFKDSDVSYVPCSGLTGENLVRPPSSPELAAWYHGPTLVALVDSFRVPERAIDKPLRMSISDVFRGAQGAGSGLCVAGRIESGALAANDRVLVCPSRETATVRSILLDEAPQNTAFAGDQVTVALAGVDPANIAVGFILCDTTTPVPVATRIGARIVVFNVRVPLTRGFPVVVHHQSLIEPATVSRLRAQLHKGTGEVLKRNPRFLTNNSCALVEIEFSRPVCMERYADFKELGRIMLRVAGVTIAAGLVTEIIK